MNNAGAMSNLVKRERTIKFQTKNQEIQIWNKIPEKTEDEIYQSFARVLHHFDTERKLNNVDNTDNLIDLVPEKKFESDFSLSSEDENPESSSNLLQRKTARDQEELILLNNLEYPEGDDLGPQPIRVEFDKKEERKFYSGAGLKKDEAELFSHYVQQGKRIPRRGEVGLSSDEINRYESLGYVMSGTRHKKMNLARMKKEQMLYTAEEKRALAIYNLEEQQRRERNIINEMKHMWKTKKDDCEEDDLEQGEPQP
jgi:hypothetical protein